VHRTSASGGDQPDNGTKAPKAKKGGDKLLSQWLADMDAPMRDLYESLRAFILALGDDVQEKQLKLYVAFRRIKNFACVVFQKKGLLLYLRLNPDTVTLEEGFTRDVHNIGHWATGDLEVTILNESSLRKAESLVVRSYEET
jgi:predicted transport protein